jgi:capsular exopolysaccharide synthesis family protein
MDHIRQAIERAKAPGAPDTLLQQQNGSPILQNSQVARAGTAGEPKSAGKAITLDGARLEDNRIISHDIANPLSRSFDMLRTQVLQTMDMNSWPLLGVTSPTPGCGKSVISINLALSIARQQERSVLLVDFDLQKPQIANHLGLKCDQGVMSVLEGRTDLSSAIIQARIRNQQFLVLPCETATPNSSEWMASRQMSALMEEIKQQFKSWTVILDLPPILTSDDVISILPQINSVLFVVAAGSTTASEIKECNKHLEATPVVRVVLNKAEDAMPSYYHY